MRSLPGYYTATQVNRLAQETKVSYFEIQPRIIHSPDKLLITVETLPSSQSQKLVLFSAMKIRFQGWSIMVYDGFLARRLQNMEKPMNSPLTQPQNPAQGSTQQQSQQQ